MDVGADFPADAQASEGVQQGEGLLDDPALFAQAGAVFGAAAGDQWADLQLSDQAAVLVVVVAAVGEYHAGPLPGSAALAAHLGDGVQQRAQLGDVVAVGAGQDDRERDAGGLGDQVMLAAGPPSIDRGRAGLRPPLAP